MKWIFAVVLALPGFALIILTIVLVEFNLM